MQSILPGLEATDAKATDVVLTPDKIAADVVRHFRPAGRMLDPCRGAGAFWKHMPGAEWCECREGRDFFTWHEKVDWIVSNPPYSIFADWMAHSLEIAEHIVYLIPLAKVFSAEKRIRDIYRVGGIVETRLYGSGTTLGFPFGWPCGAVYVRVGYSGPMAWTFYIPNAEAHERAVAHSTQVTAPAQCADIGMSAGSCQEMRNAAQTNTTTPAQPETASGACQSARKGVS